MLFSCATHILFCDMLTLFSCLGHIFLCLLLNYFLLALRIFLLSRIFFCLPCAILFILLSFMFFVTRTSAFSFVLHNFLCFCTLLFYCTARTSFLLFFTSTTCGTHYFLYLAFYFSYVFHPARLRPDLFPLSSFFYGHEARDSPVLYVVPLLVCPWHFPCLLLPLLFWYFFSVMCSHATSH